jgi:CheY-like chemotaxis protein
MERTAFSDDKRHILVLEDDNSIAELLSWVLSEAGYEVTCAGNLRDARQVCVSTDPDILIADLLLPESESDSRAACATGALPESLGGQLGPGERQQR